MDPTDPSGTLTDVSPSDYTWDATGPVVCGVDDSEEATTATRVAADLAERLGVSLVVVAVRDADKSPRSPIPAGAERRASAVEDGQRLPARLAAALPPDEAVARALHRAEGLVESGDPAERLASICAKRSAGLAIVGSRGRGPVGAALLGSVSRGLAVSAPCPVVIVPPDLRAPEPTRGQDGGTIVCGVDDSDSAPRAARVAVELGAALRLRVIFAHAERHSGPPVATQLAYEHLLEREARSRVRLVRRALGDAPAPGESEIRLLEGLEPAEALESLANEEQAQLIVVGTRGRGSLTEALGSVSRKLAASGSHPVVTVN